MLGTKFIGNKKILLEEQAIPEPGKGEVLIKVDSCAICGSDKGAYLNGHSTILGHELSGTVVTVGRETNVKEGVKVAVYAHLHCGHCSLCRKGLTNMCLQPKGFIGWDLPGGFAEYCVVPEKNLLPLASDISLEVGVLLLDMLGTAGHGLRIVQAWEAETAAVIGCGPIGLGTIALLKHFNIKTVYASDLSFERLKVAEKLGAIPVNLEKTDLAKYISSSTEYGVELAIDAVGLPATEHQALEITAPAGSVLLLGENWKTLELCPSKQILHKDLTVVGSFYFPLAEFEKNQEIALRERATLEQLISHRYPLTNIEDGFETFFSGKSTKVLIKPDSFKNNR